MPLPANRVDTVRVPNDTTTYDIVPSSLQDGSGKHSIATPTTTKDTTLVVGVKINNVTKEPTNGIVDLGTFQDGLDGDQLAAVNSGITADKVTKYEGYETKINSNTSEIGIIKDVLKSGVTFKGKITDPTLPAATDYNNGDLIIFGEKEYICFDNGTSKEWIELGDEGTHLTKAMADTYYVEKNDGITGATKCKITYDAKGLVTKGENLSASDIPSLDAGKITTGKFADERIASAATWNAKQDAITSSNKLDASLVSGLSTVATSGNYDDLSNKPAVENLVPYTGATTDINIGSHAFTMNNEFTVGDESYVYTKASPGSISFKNPMGTLSIGISSLRVDGTAIYWPTVSADPNGKYFALKSDIPANIKDGTGNGSLNQIKDGTGTTFSIDDSSGNSKNPNAYALDNTIKGDIVFGGVGDYSTSLGGKSSAQGKRSVAQGTTTIAKGNYSHAEGDNSVALGPDSHAEGYATVTYGKASHSEGTSTQALGEGSHAEGSNTKATKTGAHSEGEETDASGYASHTEGLFNKVLSEIPADTGGSGSGITPPPSTGWNIEEHRGDAGHAEGYGNVVYGFASHAEGHQNKSSGHYSHSEGLLNTASGNYSHAEGTGCLASGTGAHAGGSYCYAITSNAFAHGQSLTTNIPNQAVLGEYNLDLPFSSRETQYLFAIGNGTDANHRSNAFVSYKDGRAAIGKDPVNDLDVATKGYVDRGIGVKQDKITPTNKLPALNVSGLATVATSGNYDDLSNKPAVENLVPYTGATKNINLGGHRITTARKTLTDNDTQVQLTPDWISLINPGYGVSISADSIRVKDRVLEWPSAEGQRDTFATIGDITTKVSGFVPYEGATKDVNIGNHGILMGEPTGTLLTLDPSTIMFSLGGESQDMLYIDARTVTILNDNAGDSIYWPGAIGSTTPGAKVFALTSDITSHAGIDKVGTVTSVNGTSPDSNGNVNVNIPVTSDWEFLGKVAEKTFSKAFTEVKPGKSGIPSGNATVNVTATTYQKKVEGAIVGYKTIVDVTCRCEQFNLNDVGLNVLLSKVGSKWFMPRMAIGKGNMASTAFNTMMDKLNAQKDNVGISVDEVVVFKDNRGVSGNPGTLNVSGITNGQVVYDASEFRVFAVMLELDKDNEGKAIPCTGAHYRIVLYHPETIL